MAKPDPAPALTESEPEVPSSDPAPPADGSRRRALEMLVAAGSAAYAAALVVPAARFLASGSASDAGGPRWLRVVRLDALPEGEPARVQVQGESRDAFTVTPKLTLGSVWLERSGARVTALSAECPHLGCAVALAGDKTSFACPCHTSRFDRAGRVESGPAPRGMDPLDVRVVDGWVEVDFRRYRQGAPERVEV